MRRKLYIAWQDVDSREWSTVGLLTHDESEGYVFRYVRGAEEAHRKHGFPGIGAFPDFDTSYQSDELFSFFANRIMSPDRSEYDTLIQQVGLQPVGEPDSPEFVFDYLRRTRGWRATDSYEMFAPAGRTEQGYEWDFFTRGLRHADSDIARKWREGPPARPLRPVLDNFNDVDPDAVMIVDRKNRFLGFVPANYTAVVRKLLEAADDVEIEIIRHNREEELVQKRFLLALKAHTPEGFDLETPDELEPLVECDEVRRTGS